MTTARTQIREGFVSKIAFEIVVGEACRRLHSADREQFKCLGQIPGVKEALSQGDSFALCQS